MKFLVELFMWLSLAQTGQADPMACNSRILKNKDVRKAFLFLKRFEGVQRVGTCSLEIHLCEESDDSTGGGEIFGDLLVSDGRGRQIYAPVVFQEENTSGSAFSLDVGRQYVHYEYDDWLKDSFDGGRLSVHLELVARPGSLSVEHFEIGQYASTEPANSKGERVYQWITCGD